MMVVSVQRDQIRGTFGSSLGSLICVVDAFRRIYRTNWATETEEEEAPPPAAALLIVPWEMVLNVLSRLLAMTDGWAMVRCSALMMIAAPS